MTPSKRIFEFASMSITLALVCWNTYVSIAREGGICIGNWPAARRDFLQITRYFLTTWGGGDNRERRRHSDADHLQRVLVVAAVLAISGVGPGAHLGRVPRRRRRGARHRALELLRELGARREERVRPRRRAQALARRRPGGPAGAARAVPHTCGFDVSAVGQRRRRVALRQVVGRGPRLLISQVRGGHEARVLAADAAGLRGRHGLEDRGYTRLALVGRAIRRLARGLVAREAVEG